VAGETHAVQYEYAGSISSRFYVAFADMRVVSISKSDATG